MEYCNLLQAIPARTGDAMQMTTVLKIPNLICYTGYKTDQILAPQGVCAINLLRRNSLSRERNKIKRNMDLIEYFSVMLIIKKKFGF